MPPAKTKTTEKAPAPAAPSGAESQLLKHLNQVKDDHFNMEKVPDRHVLSSGSLNLDTEGVVFPPGAFRVCGGPNLGKTPFLLNEADILLDTVPNSRVVWFLAEGRLSEQNVKRLRHPLVYKAEDWAVGTIFVFKTNVYEAAIGLMRELVMSNPTECRYGFFIDSMDNMILRNDMAKPLEEGSKVAGAPLLTKQMFQRMGLAMRERGHWVFFISQRTASIKIDPYAKNEARQTEGSGGNALAHNADEVIEFQEWYQGDLILEKPDEKPDRLKNRAIGHNARIVIKKSSSEKRFTTVSVPIKHGIVKGSAIWREREIADQLLAWGLVTKGGSWLTLTEVLRKELTEQGFADVPEKVQGYDQLATTLEARPEVTIYLFNKLRDMISGGSK